LDLERCETGLWTPCIGDDLPELPRTDQIVFVMLLPVEGRYDSVLHGIRADIRGVQWLSRDAERSVTL
jgi:hypothetical protein